jgi:hypothetical protein
MERHQCFCAQTWGQTRERAFKSTIGEATYSYRCRMRLLYNLHRHAKSSFVFLFWPHQFMGTREEGWLRHQENFGEAHLSVAVGVVAHK